MTKLDPPDLEKGAGLIMVSERLTQVSIAISLKRIADVLTTPPLIADFKGELTPEMADRIAEELKRPSGVFVVENRTNAPVPGVIEKVLTPQHVSVPEPTVPLGVAAPGLYLFGDTLIFKSEYKTEAASVKGWQSDAYVVETGEYFWGGVTNALEREGLMLTPVKVHAP